MDVVIAYLYDSTDHEIYMRIPEVLNMSEVYCSKSQDLYSIILERLLYGIKKSRRHNNNDIPTIFPPSGIW